MIEDIKVEEKFKYKNFKATILAMPEGHRCGYVEIPKKHKYFSVDMRRLWNYDIDVHGGVTYSSEHLLDEHKSWFIGFDCIHLGDKKDESIMSEEQKELATKYPFLLENEGLVWTKEMVEDELKKLIDQL